MKKKCSINLDHVTSEQLPALLSTLSILGISFSLHYHHQDQEVDGEFSTRATTTTMHPPMTPMKAKAKPSSSNPTMMCAHAKCPKSGGFYRRDCFPRLYYCAEHKPDESYKTHKTFTFEGLQGQRRESSPPHKRVRHEATDSAADADADDDDEWLESRNHHFPCDPIHLKTPEKV